MLNLIVIEGVIETDPRILSNKDLKFLICSKNKYFNIIVKGLLSEICYKYLTGQKHIIVSGTLQQDGNILAKHIKYLK